MQDNRERILAAARTLVSEDGWSQTQIASVAAAAGVATGSVYRYFSSKAELFAQVLSAVSQREVDVLAQIAAADGTTVERLHTLVATFVRRAMRSPRLAYALIAEPCEREIDEQRLRWRAAISEVVRSVIAAGQAAQQMRTDLRADIAASVIVGGFMEGLIGPLSPLNRVSDQSAHAYQQGVGILADQIATMACASVVPPASP